MHTIPMRKLYTQLISANLFGIADRIKEFRKPLPKKKWNKKKRYTRRNGMQKG